MTTEPTSKTLRQRERILRLLLAAGPAGCSNLLLNEVGFRFAARIWELRKEWDIATVRESETVYRFVLRGKKRERQAEQLSLLGAA